MLHELVIENYAVIERLRVRFHSGLNLLTGETGSGKSIVVDALGLLLGGRASSEMIRSGAERARVSGIFDAPGDTAARALLEAAGIELDDSELLVERELLANGKSRAYVASRPVAAALLRDLAPALGDIHGQHEQQRLFAPGAQLEILDEFGGAGAAVAEVAALYHRWRACAGELAQLDAREQEKLRLADLWSFQRQEIEGAGVRAGEDEELEAERRVLQNVVRLQESAGAAYQQLYDAPEAALTQLRQARRRLEEICRIDTSLAEALESLPPAEIAIEETARALGSYLGRLEADPDRLEAVETRLAALDKLRRKYGPSLAQVLAFLEEVRANLAALEMAGERRAALEAERERLATSYQQAAERLSGLRRQAAAKLEKSIEAELKNLAMERSTFRVEFSATEWSEQGLERVAYLVSANTGEEPRALDKVASGGELSRIALALKTCTIDPGRKRRTHAAERTLVFDEVDAGIGGGTAETVGRRLKQLAASHQVLCVTHLAQIAGFADHHYFVEKHEAQGRTSASIQELSGPQRTREIGRMLSGHQLTPEALRNAEQLIRLASR